MIDEKKLLEDIDAEIKCMNAEKERYFKDGNFHNGNIIVEQISAIKIIKKIINSQSKISEWIMCSDRLPTMEECQKNDCRFILDDGNRRYQGLFDYVEKRFIWFNCDGTQTDKCVVAWQNLPESYKKPNET